MKMTRFFLDLEFTNGNYYLADIIELALLSESSRNIYHGYIRIHYPLPSRVRDLTKITDDILATNGYSFKETFIGLNAFINRETEDATTPLIIAHGGFLFDFPIWLTICKKHEIEDFSYLQHCVFVDSLQVISENGYKHPG